MAHGPFKCINCDDAFLCEKDLSRHRRLDCKKKPFHCPECGQLFSRRDSLRQHLQRHDSGKKYSCKYCNKMFDQQQNLKVHLRIHSGERPYKCPECGREFNQSQNLTTHLRVHTGAKPYVCKDCGATFRFCSGYRSHVSKSHDPSRQPGKRGRRKGAVSQKQASTSTQEIKFHRVSVIAKVPSTCINIGTSTSSATSLVNQHSAKVIKHVFPNATFATSGSLAFK